MLKTINKIKRLEKLTGQKERSARVLNNEARERVYQSLQKKERNET